MIAALLALVAVSAALSPVAAGRVRAGRERRAPCAVTGAAVAACASCLVLAGALVAGATRWATRTG